jgi:hypothetical protein
MLQYLLNFDTPTKHPLSTLIALCCWQLWKHRNGVVFRAENATIGNVM